MSWSTLIFLWFLPYSVELLGVKMSCPEKFKDRENIIVCLINSTAVKEADCSSSQPFVTFERTHNSSPLTKCYTPSFNSSTCSPTHKAATNCWCNKSDGDIFNYTFVYNASRSQDVGAQLWCKVCPSPNHHLDEDISDSCKNLQFEVLSDKDSLSGRDSQHQPANSRAAADPVVPTFILMTMLFVAWVIH